MTDNDSHDTNGHRRKGWIRRHKFLTAFGVIIALIAASAIAASGSSNDPNHHSVSAPSVSPASTKASAKASTAPISTPSLKVTHVTFVITGNVPAGQFSEVDISYGSNRDTHDVTINNGYFGRHVYRVRFDGNAQYYALDASFTSAGHLSCKIVATGPNVTPLTVSHGSASGNSGDCSAQAAPNDSKGSSWDDEQ
jgi:hypothetical protein